MNKKIFLIFLIFFLSFRFVYAQNVPLDKQALLVLKILSFDRKFDDKYPTSSVVEIGVSSQQIEDAFKAYQQLNIKGRNFKTTVMNNRDDIKKYKVVFIGSNWSKDYKSISDIANVNKIITFSEDPKAVTEGALSVSFMSEGDTTKILLSKRKSEMQGTEFSSDLFNIAKVIDK